MGGVSEPSSSFTKSMQVNGKTFTLEGLTPIAGETYHGSVSRPTNATLYSGKTAYIQSRPFKGEQCDKCNTYIYGYTALNYYVSRYKITEGTNDIVKDDSYDLVGVNSSDKFNGEPGLRFTFTANRPGKAKLNFTYYYKYNFPGTDGYVQCQNPECANYQQDPSYDVGPDLDLYQSNQTINLTVLTKYNIKYDANGGTNAPEAAEIKDSTDSRQDFELSSDVPERKGYSFLGWSEDKDAKKADYKAGSKYTMTWPDTAKTLYAVWEKENSTPTNPVTPVSPSTPAENHTVIFHYNDGTTADVTQSVADGSQAVKPGNPSRDGYTFDGWYSDAELTKSYDFSTPVKNNVELYAKWTKKNETVNPEQPAVKGFLLPRVLSSGKTAQTLTWTKVDQADGYDVYFAKCNTAYHEYPLKKVTSVKASQTRTYRRTGLKYQTPYKYIVKAYRIVNGKKTIIASSVSVHSIAGNANAKYANVRAVKTTKKTVTVKKGGSLQLKASALGYRSGKQVLSKGHCPEIRYISRDKSIAAVTASGKVKGRKIGSVKVYILGSNGVRTDVTVKIVK